MDGDYLEYEFKKYKDNLDKFVANEGRYVLIKGDNEIEFFDTYDDALKAGYEKYGIEPFLVHKINRIETILNFSRNLNISSCQA